ncbi:uncharacterized protein LOC110044577 [Orbicella faveolata]|uniref:uncharacterized protein LOC110044577 n=1 Tax=Orbicella faveolata TaxID=48498 RepID=UPI0009E28C96|nr:uncharacterized protein LOC110044577 [Orbicella faveolata]
MVHRFLPQNLTDFQYYVDMAFRVLLVLLAISMLLTSGTERSKEVSTRGRRLCLCSERVLRLSSQDSEASPSASCEEMCTFNSKAGVLSNVSPRHLRSRRDVLKQAKQCRFNRVLPDWEVKNTTVAFHRSGNNPEWFAEVSWSPYNGSSLLWIGYYILYFTGSSAEDNRVHCQIISKNQTSVNISSTKNAEIIHLKVFALPESVNSTIDHGEAELTRYSNDKPKYLGLMTPPRYTMEPTEDNITVTAYVSMAAGILVGIALGAGLLKYCLCRKKSSYFPPEFKYHAFISFQKEDSHWVSGELLPFLEKEHQIQCCLHYRDFDPGTPFLESMADGVYKSYKIIVVFSSNFLQSNYCIHELDLAQYRLLNRRDDSLIIIRIDNTDPSKLPPALQKRNFIDYSDVLERPFWKSKLLKFLNSGSQSVSTDTDNNNSSLEESNEQNGNRQARAGFDRLNSTISTATEISIVSLNEERLI